MKKVGLTLGKYAPFHKGHQLVVETMLKEVDEGILIIYDTDVISIPLTVRANWIKTMYPKLTVIEAWGGPKGYSHDRLYQIQEERFIKSLLKGRKITHFYSSEFYGEHVSKSLKAENRQVDAERNTIPVSATMIRENSFKYREYVDNIVYKDLITKVVFMGAMSTGKSTITEALAKKYKTTFASEYGRDYWQEHQVNRRIELEEFDNIAKGHIKREEEQLKNANRYLFVDTNAITTYMFSLDYHGEATPFLTQLALENYNRYDLFFLCEDDIPYDDTWDRSGDQKRHIFHQQIIQDLKRRKIPYISLKGSLEERIEKVDVVLRYFKNYSNYYGESNFEVKIHDCKTKSKRNKKS